MRRIGGSLLFCVLLTSCSSGTPERDQNALDQDPAVSVASGETEIEVARQVSGGQEPGLTPDEVPRVTTTTLPEADPAGEGLRDDDAGNSSTTTEALESSTTTAIDDTEAATTTAPTETSTTSTTTTTTTAAPATTAVQTPVDDCDAVPENCVEPGEDFSNQDLNSSVFFKSEVSGVNFSNSNLADSDFSESRAVGANFTDATLTDAIIEGADFTGANFTNADLTDAFIARTQLARAVWSNTTCPDGTNSDANNGTCEGTF